MFFTGMPFLLPKAFRCWITSNPATQLGRGRVTISLHPTFLIEERGHKLWDSEAQLAQIEFNCVLLFSTSSLGGGGIKRTTKINVRVIRLPFYEKSFDESDRKLFSLSFGVIFIKNDNEVHPRYYNGHIFS